MQVNGPNDSLAPRPRSRLWPRLPLGILLGLAVFAVAGPLSMALGRTLLPPESAHREWLSTSLFQVLMALLAIGLMLILGRGSLAAFGFRRPDRVAWLRLVAVVFIAEVVTSLAFLPAPHEGPGHFAEDFGFLETVIGVLVIASLCEEILARGLVMGILAPLADRGLGGGRLRLSLPVIVAALYFAAMHVPLLVMGIDTWMGIQILVSTFLLGLIAGYFRERSASLLPAYVAHMLANVFGMGIGRLLEWIG
jgi:membrane protease YdiL (CAAX protease family)